MGVFLFFFFQARYKQSLDPTVEEVKKLCTSLRRNAKVLLKVNKLYSLRLYTSASTGEKVRLSATIYYQQKMPLTTENGR